MAAERRGCGQDDRGSRVEEFLAMVFTHPENVETRLTR
jgi:hypothetical protein